MKRMIIILFALALACPVPAALGQEPLEALKAPVDRAIALLSDPQYQVPEKRDEQRRQFWRLIHGIFDFTEVAKRSLARNWRLFSAEEKVVFTDIFAELLGNTYLDKIQGGFDNERVEYLGQEKIRTDQALVKTRIVRDDLQIPVDYRMIKKAGVWKVYDVYVEGVSLVKNYRTQFTKILFKQTPGDLIQRLKDKVKEQEKQRELSNRTAFRGYTVACMACGQQRWQAAGLHCPTREALGAFTR